MRKVVVVEAVDWAITEGQVPSNQHWDVTRGTVCGFLVSETDEMLVLAPQWFDDGGVRCVLVVPKCTIISRTDLELQAK